MLIDKLLAFPGWVATEMRETLVNMEDLVKEVLREIATDTQGRPIEWEIPLPTSRRSIDAEAGLGEFTLQCG